MTQTETVTEANIRANVEAGIDLVNRHNGGGELIFPVKISSLEQDKIVKYYLGWLDSCIAGGYYFDNYSYELPESIEEGEVYGLAIRVNFLDKNALPDIATLDCLVKKLYRRDVMKTDQIEVLQMQVDGLQRDVFNLKGGH